MFDVPVAVGEHARAADAHDAPRAFGLRDDVFMLGLSLPGPVLGMLIPPSLLMIIYGVLAEVSIAKLFAAGVVMTGIRFAHPRHRLPIGEEESVAWSCWLS